MSNKDIILEIQPFLKRLVKKYCLPGDTNYEDFIQQANLIAIQKLKTYTKSKGGFKNYIYTAIIWGLWAELQKMLRPTTGASFRALRKRNFAIEDSLSLQVNDEELADALNYAANNNKNCVMDEIYDNEMRLKIDGILKRISKKQSEVMWLKMRGYNNPYISKILNKRVGAVKSIYRLGLKSLLRIPEIKTLK